MIVLDTNVLSELIRRQPHPGVVSCLDSLSRSGVSTTAVTAAELLYGAARLPPGRRRDALTAEIQNMLSVEFLDRIEPFDLGAATHYAQLVSDRERLGHPISLADAQIAAICRRLRAPLVTRNTSDFEHTGVQPIDPWVQARRGGAD